MNNKPDDVEALKRMGLPPDIPVIEVEFSRPYSIRWLRVCKAHHDFLHTIAEYCEGGAFTPQGWGKIKRAYNKLEPALENFRRTPPVGHEPQIIDIFFQRNVARFKANWEAIHGEAVDSGEPIKFNMSALALTDDIYKDF